MRAVVSIIGTTPNKISKYLVKVIQPTIHKNTQRIMNSNKFVNIKISDISIKTMKILPQEIYTYDIANLHSSVPIDELIIVIVYINNTDIGDFESCKNLSLTDIKKRLNYVRVPIILFSVISCGCQRIQVLLVQLLRW